MPTGVTTTGTPVSRVDSMLACSAGAVFKPLQQGASTLHTARHSIHHARSLVQHRQHCHRSRKNLHALRLAASGTFSVAAALEWRSFPRVEKLNARTHGVLPGDPPQVLQGKQRVEGLELSLEGKTTHQRLASVAGYTFLDSTTSNQMFPAEIGNELVNTPPNHSTLVHLSLAFRFSLAAVRGL